MPSFDARVDGCSYHAILNALIQRLPPQQRVVTNGQLHAGGNTTRTLQNRAKFIAERALSLSGEHRAQFVNGKVWA